MNYLPQTPFVRLLIPLLIGIVSAVYFPFPFKYTLHIVCFLFAVIGFIVLFPDKIISYRNSAWVGLLILVTLFASAYHLTIIKTERFSATHFTKYIDSCNVLRVKLIDPYLEKEKSIKAVVEILELKKKNKWIKTSGKAMIYFKKDKRALQLNYGDELILKTSFKKIPEPQNPGEFNYKRFLAFHKIFNQASVSITDWVYVGSNTGYQLYTYANRLRTTLLKVLSANHLQGDEFSVGSALLLGYTDKLDADIIAAYASTGALHVLSVSGMHVGLIYLVLQWLLAFLDKNKFSKAVKAMLLLLFLWFYATLTGLSPSVLRAAAMFSFVVIAKAYKLNTNIYNILAASAFFLCFFNPYYIMDVGFQLSYIAVIGIVYIQPKICDWWQTDNWLLDKTWALISVSFAAQLATFPLGLHYFHQFPVWFLLSNLVVIPISTAVIYIGIVLFAVASFTVVAKYVAIGFGFSVYALNYSVKYIERLPYSLIQGISITVFETWLIYGFIFLMIYYFTNRKYKYLIIAMSAGVMLLCSQVVEQYYQFQQKKIIVYNIPKTSAIDFISGKSNVLLTDTALAKNQSALLFHIKHNWWDLGVTNTKIVTDSFKNERLKVVNNVVQFYDKRMVIIDERTNYLKVKSTAIVPVKIDYLIVSKNAKVYIKELLHLYAPQQVIFDSSNSPYKIKKWMDECDALHQKYYSVEDLGALEMVI